jgi:hypothetical protein
MRTTLDLDEDILNAAKSLAKAGQTTAGRIISDTMRRAIQMGLADPSQTITTQSLAKEPSAVYGFVPLTSPGQQIVTSDMVRAIRDDLGE